MGGEERGNLKKKGNQWEVYVQDMQQVAGALFPQCDSSSVVHPKPAALRMGWIHAVCVPGGCTIAFVSKNIPTFGF